MRTTNFRLFLAALHVLALLLKLLGLVAHAAPRSEDAPTWLRNAAAAGLPPVASGAPAVVLVDEERVTVDGSGRVAKVTRFAVRILSPEGRQYAAGHAAYHTDTDTVKDMRAWLVRPSGDVVRYGKEQTLDLAAAQDDVYNESRIRVISAGDEAGAGSIFGYEITTESRSVFTQFEWYFQSRLPVVSSRFSLELPQGWRAESVTFNHPKVEPVTTGSSLTWELSSLRYIEDEPSSPPVTNLAPRLAVSFFPSAGDSAGVGRTFANWTEVAGWLAELADPQAVPDAAIAEKARSLVAGAKTDFERVRAIGRYVQGVRYAAIQMGIGRGGGYRPHAAAEVFAKSYGDCKDKANLMRTMLAAVGMTAYPVVLFAGDPTYVREEWASPQQFNHCVVAVRVGAEVEGHAVVQHPSLGRLLVVDPTDTATPVGDLPESEQGGLALVVDANAGGLVRLPVASPEMNRMERVTEANLAPSGALTATVHDRSIGSKAVAQRQAFRALNPAEYTKAIERWVGAGACGARVKKIEPADGADGSFSLDMEFTASRYGQLSNETLLVFKPVLVSRLDAIVFAAGSRKHPVVLDSAAFTERARIALPEGFAVDEMPTAVRLDTPFGSYETKYEVTEGTLVFTRSLVLRASTVPPEGYAQVCDFFEKIRAAEQAPVVLVRG